MKTNFAVAASLTLGLLSACGPPAEKQAAVPPADIEDRTAASTAATGGAPVALGLSEMQLLDADLVAADGADLGEVRQIRRNASGTVEAVVVELDDTDPDRFVTVPLTGLTTRVRGDDIDLRTSMSAAQVRSLPDAAAPLR